MKRKVATRDDLIDLLVEFGFVITKASTWTVWEHPGGTVIVLPARRKPLTKKALDRHVLVLRQAGFQLKGIEFG